MRFACPAINRSIGAVGTATATPWASTRKTLSRFSKNKLDCFAKHKAPRAETWRLSACRGVCGKRLIDGSDALLSERRYGIAIPYGLFSTTCGGRLPTSSWALTFWICAACFFTVTVSAAISFFSSSTVSCSLRNSFSNIAFTAS